MFPWYIKYPNQNDEILNLDWILSTIENLVKETDNFINLNTIKYANPILWNITSQYEANTVVIDGQTGNAYISTKAVPTGVHLNRTDYWTQIYNYADELDNLREQIAHDEGESTTATNNYSVNDLVFVNSELYRVTHNMVAGDRFVVDSNVVKTTIENELDRIKNSIDDNVTQLQENIDSEATARSEADIQLQENINAEAATRAEADTQIVTKFNNIKINNVLDFGAIGDGITDDTTAIQNAIDDAIENSKIVYFPCGKYKCSNLSVHDITLLGSGIYDGTRPYESGSILYITDNTHYGITVGDSTTIKGLGFYYPNQLGSTETPLEYPATIKINPTPSFVMQDCIFYNAYNCIEAGNSETASGKFTITNVYAYAVNKFCTLNNFIDSIHVDNCFITCGVGQDIALTGNKYLAKYTADHGVAFTLDRVDDFNIQETIIYGYYKAFEIINNFTNMMKVIGVHLDAVGMVLHVTENGTIQNVTFSNNQIFCLYDLRTESVYSCILIEGGVSKFEISDTIFEGIPYKVIVTNNQVADLTIKHCDVHHFTDYLLVSNVTGSVMIIDNKIVPASRFQPINIRSCALVIIKGNTLNNVNACFEINTVSYLVIINNVCVDAQVSSPISTIGQRIFNNNIFNKPLDQSFTVTVGTINANSTKSVTVTLNGLVVGDVVTLIPLNDGLLTNNIDYTCFVSADDTLTITFRNNSNASIDARAQGFYFRTI